MPSRPPYPRLSTVTGGVINVKEPPYNAKGDGTTNDTAAVNAALSAAMNRELTIANGDSYSPGGNTVYFPPGVYKGNFSLTGQFRRSVTIVGAGENATFLLANTSSSPVITLTGSGAPGELRVHMMDIGVHGVSYGGPGVKLVNGGEWTLQRMVMRNCSRGVEGDGALVGTISECYIYENDYGMYFAGGTAEANFIKIRDSRFISNNQWAFYLTGGSGVYFDGCNIESNLNGVSLGGATNQHAPNRVTNCWFEAQDASGAAIVASSGVKTYVDSSYFYGNGDAIEGNAVVLRHCVGGDPGTGVVDLGWT